MEKQAMAGGTIQIDSFDLWKIEQHMAKDWISTVWQTAFHEGKG